MIYFLRLPTGSIKIGYTESFRSRMKQLRQHYGCEFEVVATMPGGVDKECELHQRFAHLRFGCTEQFRPGLDLCAFIDRPSLTADDLDAIQPLNPTGTKWRPFAPNRMKAALNEAARNGFLVMRNNSAGWNLANAFYKNCLIAGKPYLKAIVGKAKASVELLPDSGVFSAPKIHHHIESVIAKKSGADTLRRSKIRFVGDGVSGSFYFQNVPLELMELVATEILERAVRVPGMPLGLNWPGGVSWEEFERLAPPDVVQFARSQPSPFQEHDAR